MQGIFNCCANSLKWELASTVMSPFAEVFHTLLYRLDINSALPARPGIAMLWMCLRHFSAPALIDASGGGKQNVSLSLTAQ